jgi:hypothetical protein
MTRAETRVRQAIVDTITQYTMLRIDIDTRLVNELVQALFHTPTFQDVRDYMTEVIAEQAQREHIG